MGWSLELAVEHNRRALLAVVAGLFLYAGIDDGDVGEATLPRLLRNAILRLLRPAESAARRLIVVAAGAVRVPVTRLSFSPLAGEMSAEPTEGGEIFAPRHPPLPSRALVEGRASPPQGGGKAAAFALTDPPRRLGPAPRPRAAGMPRISLPGLLEPQPLPLKPSPGDPVATIRLRHRLVALKRALDDLAGQAKRLARLDARAEARRQANAAAGKAGTTCRRNRLRSGRPPGHRARPRHAVDTILADCHALAREGLYRPDTS